MALSILRETFNHYDCDKASKHSYHEIYEPIFQNLLKKPTINILEIGVFGGASILAYLEYFDTMKYTGMVNIVGVDIFERVDIDTVRKRVSELSLKTNTAFSNTVKLVKLDSTNTSEVNSKLNLKPDFDLIIDDGAHDPISQAKTYKNFRKLLSNKKDSVYVIEDVWPPTKLWHPWVKDNPLYSVENFNSLVGLFDPHKSKIIDLSEQTDEPDSYCLVEKV